MIAPRVTARQIVADLAALAETHPAPPCDPALYARNVRHGLEAIADAVRELRGTGTGRAVVLRDDVLELVDPNR